MYIYREYGHGRDSNSGPATTDVGRNKLTQETVISKDADINSMCDEMLSVIHKYPNLIEGRDELLERVVLYQSEYKSLKHEVDYLEGEVEEQKKQLMMFNVNYNDAVSPIKRKEKGQGDPEDSRDVDEYIAMEEEEIRILEEKLNMTE